MFHEDAQSPRISNQQISSDDGVCISTMRYRTREAEERSLECGDKDFGMIRGVYRTFGMILTNIYNTN
ncbi:hypothetical protein Y032_0325g2551 [Ancylostoma ceylanicum]|uniref:Uncharacterized protein n=1 Tax=Ancylostoma ceylanicum TaxID=53326 RepID=A0A016S155_9BILA|nr:hypothetical protein Y032_0325g2551 [Ancylostoma ceylanicum]